jgi:hypothetical protein
LNVTEAIFWSCARDKIVPTRAGAPVPEAALPADLVYQLIKLGVPESENSGDLDIEMDLIGSIGFTQADDHGSGGMFVESAKFVTAHGGNTNFAWVQHFIYHLSRKGTAGFVLANGSLSSKSGGEGEIRRRLVEPSWWTASSRCRTSCSSTPVSR